MSDQFIPIDIMQGIEDMAEEIGKLIHIRRYTDTSSWLDASKPSLGKIRTYISCAATAIMTDFLDSMVDGTAIQLGDRRAIVSLQSVSVIPMNTDEVIMDNEHWKIITAKPIEVSGTVCSVSLQLRK